jgi:hypothetical protein
MSGSVADLLIHAAAGIFGYRGAAGEAPLVRGVGGVQHGLALVLDRRRGADMHRIGNVQPDPGMPVLMVVIGAERAGVLQRPERAGNAGQYFSVSNYASLTRGLGRRTG